VSEFPRRYGEFLEVAKSTGMIAGDKLNPIQTIRYGAPNGDADSEIELVEFRDGSVCLIGREEHVIFEVGEDPIKRAMEYLEKAGYRVAE